MRRVHNQVRKTVFSVLDVFYPIFKPFLPLQTYHYAACGGTNTVLGLTVYFVAYNYIFQKIFLILDSLLFNHTLQPCFFPFV
jgi:hypothetical protein